MQSGQIKKNDYPLVTNSNGMELENAIECCQFLPCVQYFGMHESFLASNNLDYVRRPNLSKHIGQGKSKLLEKFEIENAQKCTEIDQCFEKDIIFAASASPSAWTIFCCFSCTARST